MHSITIQEGLLRHYTMKFVRKLAELSISRQEAMARLGENWWKDKSQAKMSHFTMQRKALEKALAEAGGIERTCHLMKTRIMRSVNLESVENPHYAFQHILANSGERQLPDEAPDRRLELYEEVEQEEVDPEEVEQEEAVVSEPTLSVSVGEAPEALSNEIAPPDTNLQYRDFRCRYRFNGRKEEVYNNDPPSPRLSMPMLSYQPVTGINLSQPWCQRPQMYMPPFANADSASHYYSSTAAIPTVVIYYQQRLQITQVTHKVNLVSLERRANQLGRDIN